MTRSSKRIRSLSATLGAAVVCILCAAPAAAQDATADEAAASDSIALGDWQLRPSLQLRSRFEARRNPFDTGGRNADLPGENTSNGIRSPFVRDQWSVLERARIGLSADRNQFRAMLQIQDARVWGGTSPVSPDQRDTLPNTSAHQAFAELHGTGTHASALRVGRQEIQWGEGRLVGRSDWSPTGRSLDAARAILVVGDFDLDAFASVLVAPGALPPEARQGGLGGAEGPGAQLYGLRIAWNIAPLLKLEVNQLGRFAREPTQLLVMPSDLYLAGVRLSGHWLALDYSLEGAYELGRMAVPGDTPSIQAYAGAARVEASTGLFWDMKLGAQASYASGQKSDTTRVTRFDPILPDVHTAHGLMNLYAWSNVMEAAGTLRLNPLRDGQVLLAYRYVALAEPGDAWQSAALLRIGSAASNTSRTLGHELDFAFRYSPWTPVAIDLGYGAFLTGAAGKAILAAAGRGEHDSSGAVTAPNLQHFGYLMATMTIP